MAFGCDCDKPTGPRPDELVDYPVYFWDAASTHKLFIYHPTTKQFDSLDIPYTSIEGVTASADGKLLYLALINVVEVLETDSFTNVATIPFRSKFPVVVSPDNELVAIMGDSLWVLRTSDYSVVFFDTTGTGNGEFSDDSKTLYCEGGSQAGQGEYIFKVHFSTMETVSSRMDLGAVQVVPNADESVLLLYRQSNTFVYWFWAYDPVDDSAIYSEFLYPGGGRIARTHDGRKAFYTNPGRIIGPPGYSSFTVFDLMTNTVDHVVQTNHFIHDSTRVFVEPLWMAITPDDRWMVMTDTLIPHQVVTYDIANDTMVDWQTLGNDKFFLNLTTQSMK